MPRYSALPFIGGGNGRCLCMQDATVSCFCFRYREILIVSWYSNYFVMIGFPIKCINLRILLTSASVRQIRLLTVT